jgi:hypothetical protein
MADRAVFSCSAATRARGLIEGDLSWAPSLFCAPHSRTDKWLLEDKFGGGEGKPVAES